MLEERGATRQSGALRLLSTGTIDPAIDKGRGRSIGEGMEGDPCFMFVSGEWKMGEDGAEKKEGEKAWLWVFDGEVEPEEEAEEKEGDEGHVRE